MSKIKRKGKGKEKGRGRGRPQASWDACLAGAEVWRDQSQGFKSWELTAEIFSHSRVLPGKKSAEFPWWREHKKAWKSLFFATACLCLELGSCLWKQPPNAGTSPVANSAGVLSSKYKAGLYGVMEKKGKISPRLRNPLKKTLMSVWKCAWYSLSAHLTSLCCLLPVILQSCSAEELVAAVFASILKRSASLNRFLEVQPMLYQIYRMEYAKTVKRVSLQPSVERCWWQDGLIYTKWILH